MISTYSQQLELLHQCLEVRFLKEENARLKADVERLSNTIALRNKKIEDLQLIADRTAKILQNG
jgi:hypothetical protein